MRPKRRARTEVIIPIDAETRFVVERTRRGGIWLYTESRCLCQVRRDEAGNCRDCGGDPERQWSSPPDEGTGIDAQHVGALREALRQLEEGASSDLDHDAINRAEDALRHEYSDK